MVVSTPPSEFAWVASVSLTGKTFRLRKTCAPPL
jgi:hypothetical protein